MLPLSRWILRFLNRRHQIQGICYTLVLLLSNNNAGPGNSSLQFQCLTSSLLELCSLISFYFSHTIPFISFPLLILCPMKSKNLVYSSWLEKLLKKIIRMSTWSTNALAESALCLSVSSMWQCHDKKMEDVILLKAQMLNQCQLTWWSS